MRVRRFEWEGAAATTRETRLWAFETWPQVDVTEIEQTFRRSDDRDATLLELAARFDAADPPLESLAVEPAEQARALSRIDRDLRESLEFAAANIQRVAEAQLAAEPTRVELPQGQVVSIREVPLGAAGIYAPGGRAAYPSSVLMCAIPAKVAGVERVVLATPPGVDGAVNPAVLAAAALCGVDEIYAMGGAQAIFALAYGTKTIPRVDAVAGPGNAWVREAKASVASIVAIDSLAGPSELMVVLDGNANPQWAALDLCAQAEHGADAVLVAVAVDEEVLEAVGEETERAAASRSGVADAPLGLVHAPNLVEAVEFANLFSPEHLQLLVDDPIPLAERVTTAGCVLAGSRSATAFGDYVAGSNHVLPTSGAGRFSGPLGPGIFRRKIATVEVSAEAAAKLAPHVDRIARAEGFPVHGESAMIRTEKGS
ncbi:MAG TPA: histidinol dehydrogenase [Solirubrobacterales bacterium]